MMHKKLLKYYLSYICTDFYNRKRWKKFNAKNVKAFYMIIAYR